MPTFTLQEARALRDLYDHGYAHLVNQCRTHFARSAIEKVEANAAALEASGYNRRNDALEAMPLAE